MTAIQRLFSEGFRVFFLATGLFALAVLLVRTGVGAAPVQGSALAAGLWLASQIVMAVLGRLPSQMDAVEK